MNKTTKTDIVFKDRFITLMSTFDKANIKYMIQPCKDKYGRLPDCVKKVKNFDDVRSPEMIMSDKEKDLYSEGKIALFPENHFFTIVSGKTYDLEDMWDKAEWECIKNSPLIAKDRFEKDANGNLIIDGPASSPTKPSRYGVAELYISRPGAETQRRVSRKQLIHKAETFIYEDEHGLEGQLNMARLLGKNMSNQQAADVTDFLLRVAEKDPEKIISLYTGDDINLRLMFVEAKEKRIIVVKNKAYMYGDVVLGVTDNAVIAWMKEPKNKKVLELIRKEVYSDYEPID